MPHERFNVVQFFADGSHEYNARDLDAKAAVDRFHALTLTVGARLGTTRTVLIVDAHDCTVAEWKYGEGLTWPHAKDCRCGIDHREDSYAE